MLAFIEFLILFAFTFSLTFYRTSRYVWTPVMAVVLIIFTTYGHVSWYALTLFWILYILPAILFNIPLIRHEMLAHPLLRYFQKTLPQMSDTEREALEAGDVWWEGELFCGKPNWKKMLDMPLAKLTEEEKSFLNKQTVELCKLVNDWQVVQEDKNLPKEAWDYIKQERFWGMVIPKEYGGLGFSAYAHAAIVTRLSTHCISAAVTVMVPNSLGPGELLLKYGTNEQKNYYLPRLAEGNEIPCFALTSPDAGSDAAAMTDRGIICHGEFEGKQVLGIKVNWNKRYITLAPIATVLGLAFKCFDPDHLIGNKEDLGITVCLVPTNHKGVEVGARHYPSGMAFMNGPTRGKDVFIPLDWVIGGQENIGHGWRMLMDCLSVGRAISLPSIGVACGQMAYRTTGAYARVRRQFRTSIGRFDGVQEALGRIGGFTYICNATQHMTATAVDMGVKPSVASAIAKYHLTEFARKTINDALDVHAGRGVQLGPKNYLAHGYNSIPMSITVEGANILTRNLIIFGQGAVRCHPYIRKEMQVAALPDHTQALQEFDKLLVGHIGYAVNNVARTFLYGLSGGHFVKSPIGGPTAKYFKQLTRMSAALAMLADFSMMFMGGALKRKERLSARLGDILSYLYLGSTVLKYHEAQGRPSEDLSLVHWALTYCLVNIQRSIDEFLNNFPMRKLRWVLRHLIFPWGRSYVPPRDSLDRKISQAMMEPSNLRDRLTNLCYLGDDENHPVQRMEIALHKMIAAEPALKKIHNAIRNNIISKEANFDEQIAVGLKENIITQEEIDVLRAFEKARLDAVSVDEFLPEYFERTQHLWQENRQAEVA